MNDNEALSKDEFFKQLASLSDAMSIAHGKDFAMGALVLAARFLAEHQFNGDSPPEVTSDGAAKAPLDH